MITEIKKIVDGNYKVTEKEKMLKELEDSIREEFLNADDKIYKGYRFCDRCKEYYRADTFKDFSEGEFRNMRTFHDLSDAGNDEYQDVLCRVDYQVCPLGHKEEINVEY